MKRLSLSFLLPAAIVSLCLVIAGATAYTGVLSARHAHLNEAAETLNVALHQRAEALQAWFDAFSQDVISAAGTDEVEAALAGFGSGFEALGANAGSEIRHLYITENTRYGARRIALPDAGDGSAYSAAHAVFHPYFATLVGEKGYYDIFLISPDGDVVYTAYKETDLGENLRSGALASSGLGRAFAAAMTAQPGTIVFEDFTAYAPSAGVLAAFVATPVADASGEVIGVYAVQLPVDQIDLMLDGTAGLGETGEVTVIAADGTRRNNSRFENGTRRGDRVAMTAELSAGLRGESGSNLDAVDARGTAVVAEYDTLSVAGSTWVVIAQQDLAEILAPLADMRKEMAAVIGVMALVIVLVGSLLGRWIATPLRRLSDAMRGVAERTFEDEIPASHRGDEIGGIARTLSDFRDRLRDADRTAREVLYKSQAFTGSSVAMMISNTDGEVIYHNDAARELFNTQRGELNKVFPDLDPDRLVGVNISQFYRDRNGAGTPLSDPSSLPIRADVDFGGAKLSITASAVLDEASEFAGTVVEWADVAEVRLNSGILGAIRRNQMVVELGLDGRILAVNDAFLKSYGYAKSEVIGRPYDMLLSDGVADFAQTLRRVVKEGHANEKGRRRDKAGRDVWVESSISAIPDQSGRVFKLIEIATDVTVAQTSRMEAEARRDRMEADQLAVVNALRGGLSGLAAGDLSQTIPDAFPADYEGLRADFNDAVRHLREVVSLVIESSGNIRNGSSEISQAADDLSRRTESQAATLEQTAAAMDELTQSVKAGAESADEADAVVRDAREKAETSGTVVVQAVSAMSEIEKSSAQIGKIIGVIDDIAFQTNLLALNAGVEAARAGEAGRGFAVVASEVRALAQRSSEAAKEIKQLISMSSRHVENGVDLVGQAGAALKTIVTSVSEISTMVSEFATSSKEQFASLTEINSGVTALDQVTQQNAAMVEQSTAASHSLRSEAEGLAELISRFRIGEAEGAPIRLESRRRGASAGTAAAPRVSEVAAPAPRRAPDRQDLAAPRDVSPAATKQAAAPKPVAPKPAVTAKRVAAGAADWAQDVSIDSDAGWESF